MNHNFWKRYTHSETSTVAYMVNYIIYALLAYTLNLPQREKLEKFEEDFLDKVKAVEMSYRDRMDALMTENTMLRRRWLEKTNQFCKYQSDIEKTQAQTIRTFKDTVCARHSSLRYTYNSSHIPHTHTGSGCGKSQIEGKHWCGLWCP